MTTRWIRRVAAVALATFVTTTLVLAHHGWSEYDEKKVLTLDGVIRSSAYANPHGTAKFEVAGKVWDVVLAPVSRMEARGLTEAMLKAGKKAKVVGYPHRKIATEMRLERITIDAKTVELR